MKEIMRVTRRNVEDDGAYEYVLFEDIVDLCTVYHVVHQFDRGDDCLVCTGNDRYNMKLLMAELGEEVRDYLPFVIEYD